MKKRKSTLRDVIDPTCMILIMATGAISICSDRLTARLASVVILFLTTYLWAGCLPLITSKTKH